MSISKVSLDRDRTQSTIVGSTRDTVAYWCHPRAPGRPKPSPAGVAQHPLARGRGEPAGIPSTASIKQQTSSTLSLCKPYSLPSRHSEQTGGGAGGTALGSGKAPAVGLWPHWLRLRGAQWLLERLSQTSYDY